MFACKVCGSSLGVITLVKAGFSEVDVDTGDWDEDSPYYPPPEPEFQVSCDNDPSHKCGFEITGENLVTEIKEES